MIKNILVLVTMLVGASAVSGTAANVALLDSSVSTRNFFGQHYAYCSGGAPNALGGDEYRRYFEGWQYVLDELHASDPVKYAYQVIPEIELTDKGLANFRVLILSNDVSLSDDETDTIRKWVLSGGRLLATFGNGYKDIIEDLRQADGLKLQEGGTGGLHQLWHDPLSKLFSTLAIDPQQPQFGAVDILISRSSGPTAGVNGLLLGYGALGNLLIQRPANNPDVFALFAMNPAANWTRPQPAILSTSAGKGQVVYYAFAPEYIVSLEFDLVGHCPLDGNYPPLSATNLFAGRSSQLRPVMKATLDYLLNP